MMKPMKQLTTMKAVSKYLAQMKGSWDPEFEPSIEEIVDYR